MRTIVSVKFVLKPQEISYDNFNFSKSFLEFLSNATAFPVDHNRYALANVYTSNSFL